MKARTLVIMLCIGLMCITGFGSTTADLTENSTTEFVDHVDATSVNVVFISLEEVTHNPHQIGAAFGPAENTAASLVKDLATNLRPVLTANIPIEGDVGWQSRDQNYNLLQSNHQYSASRKPRDGINYESTLYSS